jgi:hypothetical protein
MAFNTLAQNEPCSFVQVRNVTIRTFKRGLDFQGHTAGAFSNSNNIIGLKMYECDEMITLSDKSAENHIEGSIQPRANQNIGTWAIRSTGAQNRFDVGVWDWDGLSNTAGYGIMLGVNDYVRTNMDPHLITSPHTGRFEPTVVTYGFRDTAPGTDYMIPVNKVQGGMVGEQDNHLAFAADRYTVTTTGGTAPTTARIKRMFDPLNMTACAFAAATSHSVVINLGVSITGGLKAFGVVFDTSPTGGVSLQKSTDGTEWEDIEVLGAGQMPRPHCYFADRAVLTGAFQYLRVLTTNTASAAIEIRRIYASWTGGQGAWLPVTSGVPMVQLANEAAWNASAKTPGTIYYWPEA